MTHPLKVIKHNIPVSFLRETLKRPWMRMFVFLEDGPLARTPEHYKKFYYEWKVVEPSPVHYIPKPGIWEKTEEGQIRPVQNAPIPLKYPHEMHQHLWGGEAVIKGYVKRKPKANKVAKYWVPSLLETVVYSEILDKHMKVIVTNRALDMIDQHYGLDSYILKTPPCDLMSELALKLKREMLYTLSQKTMYPDDPVKRENIYKKYEQYIIPEEEIDWYGLTLREAYRKQSKIEEAAAKTGPYKDIFRKEFIEYLKSSSEAAANESQDDSFKQGILQRLSNLSLFNKKS